MKLTVRQWRLFDKRLTPITLAQHVDSHEAKQFVRAAFDLTKADPDDEAGFIEAADRFEQAERTFLVAHSDTEVSLP